MFSEYSYIIEEDEVKFKCESEIFAETHKTSKNTNYAKTVIETCFPKMTNCSFSDVDCYLGVFKNKLNISIIKMLPNQHRLNINDFNTDKDSVNVQHHVKFALLYSNENNFSLLSNGQRLNSNKLTNSELQPILYIVYDLVKEKEGYVIFRKKCAICKKEVTNEYTFSTYIKTINHYSKELTVGSSSDPIFGHLSCFYNKIQKYNGNIKEYLMNEAPFVIETFNLIIDEYSNSKYVFKLFNRFFDFEGINTSTSLVKDYKTLAEIQTSISNYDSRYSDYIGTLTKEYENLNEYKYMKGFLNNLKMNEKSRLERLEPCINKVSYPEVAEIGESILLKLEEFINLIEQKDKTFTKELAKKIIDLGTEIVHSIEMIRERMKKIIVPPIVEVIKKYDFESSSIDILVSLSS